MRSQLSEEEIRFLYECPTSVTLDVDGWTVLFVHATPRNDVDIFTERTREEHVAPALPALTADVVVCGHTHVQFERELGGVRVVNAGSVGMAYEDAPGAYWLLDLVHRRTPYDGAELKASREEAIADDGRSDACSSCSRATSRALS